MLGLVRELAAVTGSEFREARWDVVEPLAQLVARRQLARPRVEAGPLARDAAWPRMVDQDPIAVTALGFLVDPLGTDIERHRRLSRLGRSATRPQRLLVPQMPRRRHSSWTIWL